MVCLQRSKSTFSFGPSHRHSNTFGRETNLDAVLQWLVARSGH